MVREDAGEVDYVEQRRIPWVEVDSLEEDIAEN
jgi:hypothetical protein